MQRVRAEAQAEEKEMTSAQAAAYIIAQAACATAEIAAMEAANANARRHDVTPRYDEQHFLAVPEKYGIHHNAVLATFQGANE
jgi:hypothetical protein